MGTFDKLGQGVKIAEKQREKRKHEGFLAELFKGKAPIELFFPWPEQDKAELKKETVLAEELKKFLSEVDNDHIEKTKDVPIGLVEEMSRHGFFALKIPEGLHGGKGLNEESYANIISLIASSSSAVTILISADNTIGVKYPILNYGTPEQKEKYLPELSKWPSGFCFTEKDAGSDPARMQTYALRVKNEKDEITGYKITGWKWYTTNSVLDDNTPLAKYLAVVARIVDRPEDVGESECFGIFIIPTDAAGVTLGARNYFCGMNGIPNANPKFESVFAAKDQLIGKEGDGFKIALEALNTGRIAIAAGCLAAAKQALVISRWWALERSQWGKAIGRHEAIGSGMLAPAACNIFAMEAMVHYTSSLARQNKDARLAAAVCKVFASERAWTIIDNMMQIFGGRGYETSSSLARREKTAPVERIWRDARPNRIFEGSTQILSQWFMREGLDDFLKRGTVLLEKGNWGKKLSSSLWFGKEYVKLLIPRDAVSQLPPELKNHLQSVKRNARKFARTIIFKSGQYRAKLTHKQLTMERLFWIAAELFAMSACIAYAGHLSKEFGREPYDLADIYCRDAQRRIKQYFKTLDDNDDSSLRDIANRILENKYSFLKNGIVPFVEK